MIKLTLHIQTVVTTYDIDSNRPLQTTLSNARRRNACPNNCHKSVDELAELDIDLPLSATQTNETSSHTQNNPRVPNLVPVLVAEVTD